MAYLYQQNGQEDEENKGNATQPQLYTTGQGTEAGQNQAAPAGGTGAAPATTAGRRGGFASVMDFLGANKGNQALQSQIKATGEGMLAGARQSGQSALESGRQAVTGGQGPVSLTTADLGDTAKVQSALSQQYEAPDVAGAFGQTQQGARQNLASLSGGSIEGLGSLYQPKTQSTLYRPQMRALDESLLRQDTDFLQTYAPQLQQRYQAEVASPLETEAASLQQQAQERAAATQQAKTGARSTLVDFLQGQTSKVSEKQKELETAAPTYIANEGILGAQEGFGDQGAYEAEQARAYGIDPAQFMRTNAPVVSREMAARQALGDQGLTQYNALSQMLESAGGESLGRMTGEDYTAPTQQYDLEGMRSAISQERGERNAANTAAQRQQVEAMRARNQRQDEIATEESRRDIRGQNAMQGWYTDLSRAQLAMNEARKTSDKNDDITARMALTRAEDKLKKKGGYLADQDKKQVKKAQETGLSKAKKEAAAAEKAKQDKKQKSFSKMFGR